jgi:DNA-binding NarL/FixJ family response regulator
MIKVLLADDEALVRTGFRALIDLEDDLRVVGEASDGTTTVELAAALRPDVVLMDIRMPGLDGIQATSRLRSSMPRTKVLVLTTYELDDYVFGALHAGAAGFLLKDAEPDELLHAIRVVHGGAAQLSPTVTQRLIAELTATRRPPSPILHSLTPRERDILRDVGVGRSNEEIARSLVLSPHTVKTHLKRIMAKTGTHDRAELVALAYETGLVHPGGWGP